MFYTETIARFNISYPIDRAKILGDDWHRYLTTFSSINDNNFMNSSHIL